MNGGSGTGDGRLDLDDLGEVIDAAQTVDADVRTEVLDDGRGTSWGERLEDAGITPWLRRHRVAVAVTTTACVIVVAGAAAYVRWAPPPFDPVMQVMVTELVPEQVLIGEALLSTAGPGVMGVADRARAAYGLTPADPGDTSSYALLGIDGPALRASSTNPHAADGGDTPVAADVDAILDCSDPSAVDPAPSSYALRVARTDAWGRTLVASVPVPDGATGWPAYVAANCARMHTVDGIQLRGVSVRSSDRPGALTLDLDVVNTLPVRVTATALPSGGFPVVTTALAPTAIAAGAPARLPLDLEVRDCATPTLYPIGDTDPADPDATSVRSSPGAYVQIGLATRASAADRDIAPPTGTAELHWSAALARQIDEALRRSCSGGPARPPGVEVVGPSIRITGVRIAPGEPAGTDRDISLTLRVGTTGRSVAVRTPEQPTDSYVGSFLAPARASVRDGRATLRTTWSFDCSGGADSSPPTIAVDVTTPGGEYTYQTSLNSAELSRAVLTTCSTADEQQLVDAGWVAPTPRKVLPKTGA